MTRGRMEKSDERRSLDMGMEDRDPVLPYVGRRKSFAFEAGQMKLAILLFTCFAAGCLLTACIEFDL